MIKLKYYWVILTFISAFFANSLSYADIAVVVNPANESKISIKDVKRIFLDQKKVFAGGIAVHPVDQLQDSLIRRVFTKKILKKSEKQMRVYWAKHKFNGGGSPPPVHENDDEVKRFVAMTVGGIGYIGVENVDKSVKVVFTF